MQTAPTASSPPPNGSPSSTKPAARRGIRAAIRELAEKGSPDPKTTIAALLKGAGIAYVLDAKGVPQLQ